MPSYLPPGESITDLWLERSVFAGGMLVSFAYGIYLTITGACVYFMLFRAPQGKRSWALLSYIFVLFLSSTVFWVTNWVWAQMMFIDDRNYPGGPPAFFLKDFGVWANTVSNAALLINGMLVDGLVIWRCFLIWDYKKYIIVLPVLGYIASTVFSVLTLYQTALPGNNPWTSIQFAIPYFSLSLALNISLTLLIVGRLLWHRRRLRAALGPAHGETYVGLAAMLVESAALYCATSAALIIAFAVGSYVAAFAVPLLGEVMCIAPMLILLRVASGRGYAARWHTSVSSTVALSANPMQFARDDASHPSRRANWDSISSPKTGRGLDQELLANLRRASAAAGDSQDDARRLAPDSAV